MLLINRGTVLSGRASIGSQGWSPVSSIQTDHAIKCTCVNTCALPPPSGIPSNYKHAFISALGYLSTSVAPYKLISYFIVQTNDVCLDYKADRVICMEGQSCCWEQKREGRNVMLQLLHLADTAVTKEEHCRMHRATQRLKILR